MSLVSVASNYTYVLFVCGSEPGLGCDAPIFQRKDVDSYESTGKKSLNECSDIMVQKYYLN